MTGFASTRIALPPAIDPAAFVGLDPATPIVALDGETMGTTWRVLCAARGVGADSLRDAVVARLAGLVGEMSHWDADSLLSRFNRLPAGAWLALPPDFATVIATALAIAAASDGAFDPAIGRIVDAWGFGAIPVGAPPDPAALAVACAASGWRRLQWDAGARRLRQPGGLALDLSGIAKGYAADALPGLLADRGIRHCLVEVGGELVGRGVRRDGEPWWVDLEVPPGRALPPLRVALHDLAVATSGTYRRGDHNLDPRTGQPAAGGVVAVSVIAADAMTADAWATALTVSGPDAGMASAARLGLAARFVTGDGERLSPALTAMLGD